MTASAAPEFVFGAALAAWLAVSVVAQLPDRFAEVLRRRDRANLLPLWSFFAPNPGVSDLYLLCRDERSDGTRTTWRDVTPVNNRRWYAPLWNPGRRARKYLFDVTNTLLLFAAQDLGSARVALIQTSLPYLSLLNYVSHLPRPANHVRTQFVVAQMDPGTRRLAASASPLVSEFHAIGRNSEQLA
ncbi:hypothetical protein [Mycolicibacterium sp.]|uniref:hypothetical protein n=1 Tax=Mycolicibacterium sp. TaxID=2320850 RepID=UPI001A25CBE8|nr:hypothetical protein [Mycolicibacterium sp.]MBJ7341725.1 hypothetical protein [Mycolicibacterium sp.]